MSDMCIPEGTDWGCIFSDEEVAGLDPVTRERSEALAWSTLSSLTGYRLSLCPITIRPCSARCSGQTWFVAPVWDGTFAGAPEGGAFQPFVSNGTWFNACGCSTPGDCSCSTLCEAILPGAVGSISEVWLDGEIVPDDEYRVDNGNRLVLTNGDCFPGCQDMSVSDPLDGGFWVTYYPGVAPNDLFKYAAGVLATEFYKACTGGKCRLPAGVTSVARNGITFEVASGLFTTGWTGIREVDAVIRVYNPNGLVQPPRVLSPDQRRGRIPTWSR